MTTHAAPRPASDSVFRTVCVTRTDEAGCEYLTAVEQYVAVDGQWVDVHELIDAWRVRSAAAAARIEYLGALRAPA